MNADDQPDKSSGMDTNKGAVRAVSGPPTPDELAGESSVQEGNNLGVVAPLETREEVNDGEHESPSSSHDSIGGNSIAGSQGISAGPVQETTSAGLPVERGGPSSPQPISPEDNCMPIDRNNSVDIALCSIKDDIQSKKMEPDPSPMVQPVASPVVQPEIQPEVQPEVQPEIQPEVQPEIQPEVQPEIQPEVQPEIQPEVQPEASPARCSAL